MIEETAVDVKFSDLYDLYFRIRHSMLSEDILRVFPRLIIEQEGPCYSERRDSLVVRYTQKNLKIKSMIVHKDKKIMDNEILELYESLVSFSQGRRMQAVEDTVGQPESLRYTNTLLHRFKFSDTTDRRYVREDLPVITYPKSFN